MTNSDDAQSKPREDLIKGMNAAAESNMKALASMVPQDNKQQPPREWIITRANIIIGPIPGKYESITVVERSRLEQVQAERDQAIADAKALAARIDCVLRETWILTLADKERWQGLLRAALTDEMRKRYGV